ncbi:hypothetical protein I7I53_04140 [Histoplasma capsulatum var. duboisii H88]|uniref:Uncharacterized protein n=1 Tax=Ajellomyces capsulatus (strain H88) TaxID=544711 RepID=A0A8A1LQ46_AJEC8|nr:hypothetical protein I7I53_04140 [Histoplasma capsulatum var. duboisii H88]
MYAESSKSPSCTRSMRIPSFRVCQSTKKLSALISARKTDVVSATTKPIIYILEVFKINRVNVFQYVLTATRTEEAVSKQSYYHNYTRGNSFNLPGKANPARGKGFFLKNSFNFIIATRLADILTRVYVGSRYCACLAIEGGFRQSGFAARKIQHE